MLGFLNKQSAVLKSSASGSERACLKEDCKANNHCIEHRTVAVQQQMTERSLKEVQMFHAEHECRECEELSWENHGTVGKNPKTIQWTKRNDALCPWFLEERDVQQL